MAKPARRARSLEDSSAFEAGTRLVERHAERVMQSPTPRSGSAATCTGNR